eukprot:scaffold2298_cov388-Prasinococcus_capsulatus_cf.AAC.14
MYYDDLPIWGFIGKVEKIMKPGDTELRFYLFTHVHFDISYNEDKVIEINVSTDPLRTVDITEGDSMSVQFSYSATVRARPMPPGVDGPDVSLSSGMRCAVETYYYSIRPAHGEILQILLLATAPGDPLVLYHQLLRYRASVDGYTREDEIDDAEETGWKYIHGDVFRFPVNKSLFCAFVGTGTQLLFMVFFIFMLALVGVFYPYNRGALFTACILIYACTAGIAGYISSLYYKQMEGTNWVRNVILTAMLFCGPFFLTFSFLNTVAIGYRSTAALPFGTICIVIVIWALITFPLTVLGGIAGKNSKSEFYAPCRTTKYPREVPALPWYRKPLPQMCMAGFLPFSAIYIELYYIFASVWGHKVWTHHPSPVLAASLPLPIALPHSYAGLRRAFAGVHYLLDTVHCLHYSHHRDRLHYHRVDLFPACR